MSPDPRIIKTEAEWRDKLTPEQYHVTREHGTERPFSHPYSKDKTSGMYTCVNCGADLFSSDTKYDSGTGWPSFYAPVSDEAVSEHADRSLFMTRTEVRCAKCDAHLGHLFNDGPEPTGLRCCMNGTALKRESEKT
jgi:peptide-methionine (R)-S-oxide reductase